MTSATFLNGLECTWLRGLAVGTVAWLAPGQAQAQSIDVLPETARVVTIWLPQANVQVPLGPAYRLQGYGLLPLGDQRGVIPLLSVSRPLNRYVTAGGSYLGLFRPAAPDGSSRHEQRARLAATFTLPRSGWYLSVRSMGEYRFRPGPNSLRYRQFLRVEDTVRLGRHCLTAYLADEVYYDTQPGRWTINQLTVGFSWLLTRRFTGEAYYLYQAVYPATAVHLVALGLALRLPARARPGTPMR